MTTPQNNLLTGQVGYNNTAQRWYSTGNGRFVSQQSVVDEMHRHQEATYDVLDSTTRQLYAGSINLQQWELAVASELKDAHLAQALFAIGGKNNATQANYGRVGGTLRDEYGYLHNFANDISAGRVSEAQALARIKQYGKATQQSYHREWVQVRKGKKINWNVNPGENCSGCLDMQSQNPHDAESMTKFPGSGDTPCRGNCNCTLSEAA